MAENQEDLTVFDERAKESRIIGFRVILNEWGQSNINFAKKGRATTKLPINTTLTLIILNVSPDPHGSAVNCLLK